MRESPRIRRLRTDLRALELLRGQSTIFNFSVPGPTGRGLPEAYVVRFHGKGFWRPPNSDEILIREEHELSIVLGAEYPRMMPELSWRTPIFHPNISGSGVVCLGGYGSFWAPSLSLEELCHMVWDMIRYRNYDVESPYNREAALWAKTQPHFEFPIDARPLRNHGEITEAALSERKPPVSAPRQPNVLRDSSVIIEAELVEAEDPDIVFID